eukprot:996692-Amorphochlora_amoeboformis.AAC.1
MAYPSWSPLLSLSRIRQRVVGFFRDFQENFNLSSILTRTSVTGGGVTVRWKGLKCMVSIARGMIERMQAQ